MTRGAGRGIALGLAIWAVTSPAFADHGLDVAIGKAVFDRMWAPAPASTTNADGLGPLFAARACGSCHAASGGRTTFRLGRDDPAAHPGLVLRLGARDGAPDPVYGRELQPSGAGGAAGEGRPAVRVAAGAAPDWRIEGAGYAPLDPLTWISARVAPSLAGLGRLARVSDASIVAREDPDDRDGDGVSGRAHRVLTADGGGAIGRFGWKASEPTLASQTAAAFALDLGLSTTLRPDPAGDCTAAQTACRAAPSGTASDGGPEVADALFDRLTAFLESRPAPISGVGRARGKTLFAHVGCAACHAPSLPADGGGAVAAYTDLLLHDLGPGLDDSLGEGAADSAEWRTAPLWGVSAALAQGSGLLHDGRAATVRDAIGWHGGEAERARRRFDTLSAKDRNALVNFVNQL